jgi:iron(III) transport system ATP-binding protein
LPVLSGLDLSVEAGTLTAVLGPSGCGKTTLLRLIAGFESPDGGEIRLGDKTLSDARTHLAPERREVGFVPQEGALFPHLDVAANVGFGLRRSERNGRVEELLELVSMQNQARRFPHELSGGQQQRVALARALAPGPGLVLLDEPFDALDAGLRAQVREEVRTMLAEAGTTALLVTHDQEEALSLADFVAVMRDGRIVQSANPHALYHDPIDERVALFVGDAVLLEGQLEDGFAQTALGRLPVREVDGSSGTVTLMLRPEQIRCHPPDREGILGQVLSTQFYGHDAVARIALAEGGPEILARAVGHRLPAKGQPVRVSIEGTAVVYPAATNGSATASFSSPRDSVPLPR